MSPAEQTVAVLFADIAGSSRLYEKLGDAEALATITRCLELAREAAAEFGGRLVKMIGDEAMIVFPTADQAAAAAAEIQGRMSELAAVGDQRLAFRMGLHFGAAIERDGDVFGDSVNIAARMVALAKGGQIILSAATAETLPPSVRRQLRALDLVTLKDKEQDVGIMELTWQDPADLTEMVMRPRPQLSVAALELRHGERTILLNADTVALTLGRDTRNDVVIADRLASRLHARIERRRDKFALIDQSSNGTYVTFDGEQEFLLHRGDLLLRGSGRLSFGHACEADPGETLAFSSRES